MLDFTDPYFPFIALSYGLAAGVLAGIVLLQLRQYRKTRRQLEIFKEQP